MIKPVKIVQTAFPLLEKWQVMTYEIGRVTNWFSHIEEMVAMTVVVKYDSNVQEKLCVCACVCVYAWE